MLLGPQHLPIPWEAGLEGNIFKFMIDDINPVRQSSQARFIRSQNAHSLEFSFPFHFPRRMF